MLVRDALKKWPAARRTNAFLKAHLQDLSAAASLAGYRAIASVRGIAEPLESHLAAELGRRLAGRDALTRARNGSLHTFLAYPLTNWEAVLPRAFSTFGPVTSFEWRSLGYDDRAPDWLARRDDMNAAMLQAFEDAHRSRPVDAFVGYLSGRDTSPALLRTIARRGCVLFNFCWDDKVRFPGPKFGGRYSSPAAIASTIDLNLTNAPESVLKYALHGGLAMFSPEAAHPDVHCPVDVPLDIDVSFVGACYGQRPQFITELRKHGIFVECFGRGWPNGPLNDSQMKEIFSRSRINLGFGGVGYSTRLLCLKGRDFEIPMSGGLYLTQHNPELSLVFDLGREILTYRSAADCAATVKRLLAAPELAADVRRRGRARCLRDHTYEARWRAIFRLTGLLPRDEQR